LFFQRSLLAGKLVERVEMRRAVLTEAAQYSQLPSLRRSGTSAFGEPGTSSGCPQSHGEAQKNGKHAVLMRVKSDNTTKFVAIPFARA
jgi:hypothetical protein